MLILISDAFDNVLPGKLARFGEVTDDQARLPEADIVLIRSKTKCTKEWIDQATNLKLIIRGGVGMDNIDREYAASKGIKSVNTAAASAIAVAELSFALMLAVPNRLIEGHNGMKEGKWLKKELKRTELFGKTLGLLGIGNIGTEVAKRAAAFGMKVIAYRQSDKPSAYAEIVANVDDLYARADYISIHLPLNDASKGMIDAAAIAKMKDGVIIVNTGRGKVVIEADLAAALTAGKVAAYAADVWYSDPPADDCPLLHAPNVLMTPHIGASTKENMGRIGEIAVQIISDFIKD
ncbi:MAG TPA: NAD(P)-dependent oxidoreductase [bacterium]|nr:NAD(P)-dependent oxidoreductase [bacterium]